MLPSQSLTFSNYCLQCLLQTGGRKESFSSAFIWSLQSLSKPVHYSCAGHWRPESCCIQGFPFAFKHFNATLIHHIMHLSDTHSTIRTVNELARGPFSLHPILNTTTRPPLVLRICIRFNSSPLFSQKSTQIHTRARSHRCTKDTQILLSLCTSLSWDLHGHTVSL